MGAWSAWENVTKFSEVRRREVFWGHSYFQRHAFEELLHKFLLLHTTGYKAGTPGIFYIKLNVQQSSSAWNMSKANFNCVALFVFFFSFKMIGNYLFISIYDHVSNLLDWFCPESQAKCCHAWIRITREEPELKVGNTTDHAQWYKGQ